MLFLSRFCYAFVCVCLLMPCGHMPGKRDLLTLVVMSNCAVVTFQFVWCLIVSIPDTCPFCYFVPDEIPRPVYALFVVRPPKINLHHAQ